MRAPFQVLVFPYKIKNEKTLFAIFRRTMGSGGYWQAIAGGGENQETELDAARRESQEEANIQSKVFIKLDSLSTIPVSKISGFLWGREMLVIPEYCFAVEIKDNEEIQLSNEHTEYKWVEYEEALKDLQWDSNKNALWELNYRIENLLI